MESMLCCGSRRWVADVRHLRLFIGFLGTERRGGGGRKWSFRIGRWGRSGCRGVGNGEDGVKGGGMFASDGFLTGG